MKSLARSRPAVDPAVFGDPLASQVEWTPLRPGGTNFCTHRLVSTDPQRWEFRATVGALVFYWLFIGTGAAVLLGVCPFLILSRGIGPESVATAIGGAVFLCIGLLMLKLGTTPVVFDKRHGWFWRGRRRPYEVFDPRELKNCARIEDIHALQLVSEYCRGSKSSYYSYELNLILRDGSRLNVVDHGNLRRLREDAGRLAAHLGKPLWDATAPAAGGGASR